MKRSRFSEEQIIGILKEHQAGLSAGDLCRRHGISDATFYKWRSKYGGMEVSDARKLKALENENRKLKKLLAETMLDAATLKEMLGKKLLTPRARRTAVSWAIKERNYSSVVRAGWWAWSRRPSAMRRSGRTMHRSDSG
jgi:putative transposase